MNVSIRPLVEQDAYISYKWRNDPEVFKYTGNVYTEEITLESELAWIRRVIENTNEYRCAILVDNVYVGNVYLTNIVKGKSAEYHIFIGDKSYWGRGVAKKASLEIIKYALMVLKLRFICLSVRYSNVTAIKLYESIGFVKNDSDENFILMKLNLEPTKE